MTNTHCIRKEVAALVMTVEQLKATTYHEIRNILLNIVQRRL